jgi:hypothetical protein
MIFPAKPILVLLLILTGISAYYGKRHPYLLTALLAVDALYGYMYWKLLNAAAQINYKPSHKCLRRITAQAS